jgi:hypothetical protein
MLTLTADPIPSAQLHDRETRIQTSLNPKGNEYTSSNCYQQLQLRSFFHQKCVTKFLLLEFENNRPWYYLLQSNNALEDDVDCPEVILEDQRKTSATLPATFIKSGGFTVSTVVHCNLCW